MYSSSVWDPYSIPDINKLEKVQHFALKLCNIHLSISSLIINPLLIMLFYSHYKFSIVIDALYISFGIECLLCFNKKKKLSAKTVSVTVLD